MPWQNSSDIWSLLSALLISLISGFISISRRILRGYPYTALWIVSEFITAVFCGYLMYQVYPTIQSILPEWFIQPLAVATAAHIGGRVFQEMEQRFVDKYKSFLD